MSDKPEDIESGRLWALLLLVPALGSFIGVLADIYLNIRWLAFASGDTESVWVDTIAPVVMANLIALMIVGIQMAIIGRIYRIDISPGTWKLSAQDSPWTLVAFLAAVAGAFFASLGIAPFMFADQRLLGASPNTIMIVTLIFAGLFVAPMIVRGERARVGGGRGDS